MGEADFAQSQTSQACRQAIEEYERVADEALRVQTPGGVFEVQWRSDSKATAMGQLAFFAEFLKMSGSLRGDSVAPEVLGSLGLQAKTSRPKLLSAVGKLTSHARVSKIVLALTHEAATHIKAMIVNVRAGVEYIRRSAPQLTSHQRWYALARYIADKILAVVPNTPAPAPAATG